jgi:Plasmid pRiA4b ORF-3-like protein
MADAPRTLQIKVTLRDIKPPVWRRLVVSGSATLDALHRVLQVAMGWDNYHLHCFRIGGVRYGPADDEDFDLEEIDETTVTVAEAFANNRRGFYDYDFGDSWEHELLVEKLDPLAILLPVAVCTAGKRACPPEDCGGTFGYAELLEALADPAHEEHAEYVEWAGDFDPEEFDPEAVNFALNLLR